MCKFQPWMIHMVAYATLIAAILIEAALLAAKPSQCVDASGDQVNTILHCNTALMVKYITGSGGGYLP